MTTTNTLSTEQILARFKVIEDREVLNRVEFEQGPRIGRTQTILDTQTGVKTKVNFWFQSGKLVRVQ